jgi:trehalose synthase-fused probable maltokinase
MNAPILPTGADWSSLLDGDARARLEREALLPFLARQRWFAGKARRATGVRIADWGALSPSDDAAFLCLLDVIFADGSRDLYFAPLATSGAAAADRIERDHPANVVARLSGARQGVLHDVLEDSVAPILLDAIATGRRFPTRSGEVRAVPTSAFGGGRGTVPTPGLRARRLSGEQSNTSLLFGDRLILKVLRRVEPGLNPDYEIGRHLTERSPFDRAPRLTGALEYHAGTGVIIVGVMHAFVEHDANAWDDSLDHARAFFDRVRSRPEPPVQALSDATAIVIASQSGAPALARETTGGYLEKAALLGRRTAELHLALARSAGDDAFEPEPLTRLECSALAEEMRTRALEAIAVLRASLDRVPAPLVPGARRLVGAPDTCAVPFARLARLDPGISKIRVHGDYHLGQVLWARGEVVIIDFEGEPLRPIAERRRKQPAVKDVAGMMRSFSYVARAALSERASDRQDELARLDPWAEVWCGWTSAAFLRAYLQTAGGSPFVPRDPAVFDILLRAFLLDKACYELSYELNSRPGWLRIPLMGILSTIGDP